MSIGALPCFCLLSHGFCFSFLAIKFLVLLVNANLCDKENKLN